MSNTSVQPTWLVEFNDRISRFAKDVDIPEEKIREVFVALGVDGKDERSLRMIESDDYVPMNDLFEAFVDSGLTQKAKLRLGVAHLRGKSDTKTGSDTIVSSIEKLANAARPKTAWTDEELLKAYDNQDSEIWEILRNRVHGRHCIIYNKDGSVNIENSLSLVRIAKRQPTNDNHMISGMPVRVYRPGDFPLSMSLVDESPFFRGVALVDGTCGNSMTDWNGVLHETRVLVYIQVHEIERVKLAHHSMRQLWESARKGTVYFRENYPMAALRYNELADKGDLPKLKVNQQEASEPRTGKADTAF